MADTEYLGLVVDIETRNNGADEAIKKMDVINNKLKEMHRTASEAQDYNTGLMSSESVQLMERTLSHADSISDALNAGRSFMSDMASYGANLGSELGSIASLFSGDQMTSLSNMSFSELSKLEEKYQREVEKYRESVNLNIVSHQFYTTKQLQELAKEEDIVREKMALIKQEMADLDAQTNGMSFSEFKSLDEDLRSTEAKLRQITNDRERLSQKLANASENGAELSVIQAMETQIRELNRQYVELENHSEVLNSQIAAYGGYWTDSAVLQSVEQMNASLTEQEKALNRINTARERILNASPADTQKSFALNFARYENAQSKLEQVQQALGGVSYEGERAGNSLSNAFSKSKSSASGWNNFLKSMKNRLSSIAGVAGKVGSAIRNWRKDQKSVTDQAKTLYNTFNSLWRMLKNRAKRRFVGLVFEDLVATVGEIAKISPRFNRAFSNFIVSSKTLGAQIIAAFEPLASVVLPILSQFIDYLTYGAEKLSEFISRATGNLQFIKATKGQYDYAASLDKTTSSTKKATKAAKDYKNTVMSFDQLHKLNGDDDSALDDALGLNGVDLGYANNKVDAINELGERLWNALTSHDFREAGHVLGDAVNMGFGWLKNTFGWESNGARLTKILWDVKEAVNGLIESLDGKTIGEAIGDILNTPIELWRKWTDRVNGFDFRELGVKLGEILGNAVKTIKWKDLGAGIIAGIQGTVRTVNGFMSTKFLNEETGEMESIFAVLGHAVAELFDGMVSEMRPEDWSELFSGLINGFFEFIATAFSSPEKAAELGKKLADTLNQTIRKIDPQKVSGGINAFTASFTSFFESIFDGLDWSGLLDQLSEIAKGLNWGDLGETIGILMMPSLLSGLFSGLVVHGLGSIGASITAAITAAFTELGVTSAWFVALAAAAGVIVASNWDDIKSAYGDAKQMYDWMKEDIEAFLRGDKPTGHQQMTEEMARPTVSGERESYNGSIAQLSQGLTKELHEMGLAQQTYKEDRIHNKGLIATAFNWGMETIMNKVSGYVEDGMAPLRPYIQDLENVLESTGSFIGEHTDYGKWMRGAIEEAHQQAYNVVASEGRQTGLSGWANSVVSGANKDSDENKPWYAFDSTQLYDAMPEWFKNRDTNTLSEMDGTTFSRSLMEEAKSAIGMPSESIGVQPYETLKTDITTAVSDGMSSALETAQKNGDNNITLTVLLDGKQITSAVNRENSRRNKLSNPFFAGAY